MLKAGKIDESFQYLTALLIEKYGDEVEFKKLGELYDYLVKNREGLILGGLELPELPGKLFFRFETFSNVEKSVKFRVIFKG